MTEDSHCLFGSNTSLIGLWLVFDGNTDVDAIERVEPSEVRTG
jgi:hypothetical protein